QPNRDGTRMTPQKPRLRDAPRARRDRRLHLDLDERPAEVRPAFELAAELGQPLRDGEIGLLAGREVPDGRRDLLRRQLHRVHDAARGADLLLRDPPVDLRDPAHELERRPEEETAEFARHRPALAVLAGEAVTLVEPVSENEAQQRPDRPGRGKAEQAAYGLPDPLHPGSG